MRDGGSAELAGSGLDACPLERQPVSRMSHPREKLEVLGEAMEMVDRVAGRLPRRAAGTVFVAPPVRVVIVAFHLVGRRCGAPEEVGWEIARHGAPRTTRG